MEPAPAVKEYDWPTLVALSARVADRIIAAGIRPTVVVAVLRGGAFPALLLSHLLGIRRMYAIRGAVTATESARSRRDPTLIEGVCGLPELRDDVVLMVDDVTNTGTTLLAGRAALEAERGPRAVHTACLVWDTVAPGDVGRPGECPADVYGESAHAWVSFPWERIR